MKFVLLFFLTPLGFFKLLLPKLEKLSEFQLSGDLPIMVSTPDGIYPNFTYQTNKTVVIIWIVTAIIIFIWQQLKYFHLKKLVKQSMTDIVDLNILSFIDYCRHNMGIKRKVQVFYSNYLGPFTTGFFSPVIVLPTGLPFEKQKLIIKHEMVHIHRCDTLFLFLRHLVACFYWFNPLAYLFEAQVEKIVEASCDESVIRDMSQKERKAYALLIIDMAAYDVQYRRTYASSFSNSTTSLKERMDIIMTPPKTKKFSRKLSVILTSCMVLCSSFTSFAYQPSTELDMLGTFSTNPLSNINSSDTVVFQSGDFQPENQYGPILYNNQFTDINGNIYNIDSDRSSYATCEHNYIYGTLSRHTKKSDGSCITKFYDSQRCTNCGQLIVGELINTETYTKCPH